MTASCDAHIQQTTSGYFSELFPPSNPPYLPTSLTCQVLQAKFPESKITILPVVKEYCQSVSVFIELGPTNNAQVLQGQVFKLIQSHQNIACDFSDRLKDKNETNRLGAVHLQLYWICHTSDALTWDRVQHKFKLQLL